MQSFGDVDVIVCVAFIFPNTTVTMRLTFLLLMSVTAVR